MSGDWKPQSDWLGRLSPFIGSRAIPQERRDAAYAAYLKSTKVVASQLAEAGDGPWWTSPERTAGVARKLGLAADTPVDDVRKALFLKRYPE